MPKKGKSKRELDVPCEQTIVAGEPGRVVLDFGPDLRVNDDGTVSVPTEVAMAYVCDQSVRDAVREAARRSKIREHRGPAIGFEIVPVSVN